MQRLMTIALLSATALPATAFAQEIIMRKPLSGAVFGGPGGYQAPSGNGAPTPAPAPVAGTWTTSAPSAISPSCSAQAPANRDVWCAGPGGDRLADANCAAAGPRPSGTTTIADYSGCGYVWQPIGQTTWSSTCSDSAVATRTYVCQRQDGVTVSAANCDTSHRETETETAANLTECGYEVSAWRSQSYSSQCSAKAIVTYEATACIRFGGGEMPKQVPVEQCRAAGQPMTRQQSLEVYDGCTYQPTYDTTAACVNGTRTSTIKSCTRSDGTPVALSECSAQQQSITSQCTNYVCQPASTRNVSNNVYTGFKSSDFAGKNAAQMKSWVENMAPGRKVVIYSISDGTAGSVPAGTVVSAGYGDVLPQFNQTPAYATWYSCVPG